MRRNFLILSLSSLLIAMTNALAQDLKEGQVWSYRTRPNEKGSTLLINKVESDAKLGSIFHISVSGLKVKNRHAPSGVTQYLPHFPVSKKTLEDSALNRVVTATPNPEYREGYITWKQAFDAGNAGIFTISVAEIVAFVEKTVNQ